MLAKTQDILINTFLQQNAQINLSSFRTYEQVYTKHILDTSEWFWLLDGLKFETAVDVWTWWWFPLLVLADRYPVSWTGLDSTAKKLAAVEYIAQKSWINISTYRWRLEDHKQRYDLVTARAVWHAHTILPGLCRIAKKYIMLYKLYTPDEDDIIRNRPWIHKIVTHEYTLEQSKRILYLLYVWKNVE